MTVSDHHGPELVALALANLRDRFPVAFARLGVSAMHPAAANTRCGCGALGVVTASDGDGGRDPLCFCHAEDELESLEPLETTRDRSGHSEPRG